MHRIHNEFRSPAPRHIVGFYMRASEIGCQPTCSTATPFILRSSQHNARSLDGIDYLYYLIYDDEYIYIHFNELRMSFVWVHRISAGLPLHRRQSDKAGGCFFGRRSADPHVYQRFYKAWNFLHRFPRSQFIYKVKVRKLINNLLGENILPSDGAGSAVTVVPIELHFQVIPVNHFYYLIHDVSYIYIHFNELGMSHEEVFLDAYVIFSEPSMELSRSTTRRPTCHCLD